MDLPQVPLESSELSGLPIQTAFRRRLTYANKRRTDANILKPDVDGSIAVVSTHVANGSLLQTPCVIELLVSRDVLERRPDILFVETPFFGSVLERFVSGKRLHELNPAWFVGKSYESRFVPLVGRVQLSLENEIEWCDTHEAEMGEQVKTERITELKNQLLKLREFAQSVAAAQLKLGVQVARELECRATLDT
jgi:hypothetical protein